jgi:hypothetical protein
MRAFEMAAWCTADGRGTQPRARNPIVGYRVTRVNEGTELARTWLGISRRAVCASVAEFISAT